MKKKWIVSTALVGMLAVTPLLGFSQSEHHQTNEYSFESGGIGVPIGVGPFAPNIYHKPVDGIISGALGCVPDIHVFDKSGGARNPDGSVDQEHIVFTAGVSEISAQADAEKFSKDNKIYVQIFSGKKKVLELPFALHETPDPNTKKPFWVSALYFEGFVGGEGRTAKNLPTGEYRYQFKAVDEEGRLVDVWKPKNDKFTIVDSEK